MNLQTVLILCALASGCSSGNSSSNATPSDDEQINSFDATYDLNVTSTTPFETDGGECGDATGTMTVVNSIITGSALSTGGYMYSISGNVTSNSQVNGGFAVSGENVATFEGVITGTTGSGTWSENFGCSGTWEIISNANIPLEDAAEFDGTYEFSANSSGACGGGGGSMTIDNSQISGSLLGEITGQLFDLSGTVINGGYINEGRAVSQQEVVFYEGRIVGDSGSGTWMDSFGCLGAWSMRRVSDTA